MLHDTELRVIETMILEMEGLEKQVRAGARAAPRERFEQRWAKRQTW